MGDLPSFSSFFIPGRALFGCYPSCERVKLLKETGVKYFVDLTIPGEVRDPYSGVPNYLNYPIADRKAPGDSTTFASLVLRLRDTITSLGKGDLMYVHCRGGHGRAGVVVAVLLRLLDPGMSVSDALAETTRLHGLRTEMRQKWRDLGSPQTRHQKAFVYCFFAPLSFYRAYRRGPTAGFSVCSAHPVSVPERLSPWIPSGTFGSTAGAFEASRRPGDAAYVSRHRSSKNPRMARRIGQSVTAIDGWEEAREGILEMVVHLKMQQHPTVFAKLVATGCRPLSYNCRQCPFMGVGRNALGRILERLRDRHLLENSQQFSALSAEMRVPVLAT